MTECMVALMGISTACLALMTALTLKRGQKKAPPLPGEDIALPGEETTEQRRLKEWLQLMSYAGERGGRP